MKAPAEIQRAHSSSVVGLMKPQMSAPALLVDIDLRGSRWCAAAGINVQPCLQALKSQWQPRDEALTHHAFLQGVQHCTEDGEPQLCRKAPDSGCCPAVEPGDTLFCRVSAAQAGHLSRRHPPFEQHPAICSRPADKVKSHAGQHALSLQEREALQ